MTLAATSSSTITLCSTWRVQYVDSGLGEDVFNTGSWQDVPAIFADAVVLSVAGNSLYWQGNLDINGCATVSLPAGSYKIQQSTAGTWDNNITFDSYYMSGGQEFTYNLFANFSSSGSGSTTVTLHPTFNNDAVQAAAVAGQVLAASKFNGGMGLTQGTYTIHTNEGCGAPIQPPTDSCHDNANDLVHIGTTVIGSTPESHWKYIIAHELGHYVQARGMGLIENDYSKSVGLALCRCDHYSTSWGNRLHCLQSREALGAAMNEGFGHAFASRTFNYTQLARATFVYYKPFLPAEGAPVQNPPLAVDAFNAERWMEENCPGTNRGTEYDWLEFYYKVASSSSANNTRFSDLFKIYKKACSGSTSIPCADDAVSWSQLRSAAQSYYGGSSTDARFVRFRTTGEDYGVAH